MPPRNPTYFEGIPWHTRVAKQIKRKWHRFKFAAIQVPLLREGAPGTHLPVLIWRTPRITKRRKRLAIKPPHQLPEYERKTRKLIIAYHNRMRRISDGPFPQHYTIHLSKRYPPIYERRIEDYYDVPTLRLFLDKKMNRRTERFLRRNGITMDEAHELALKVDTELDTNIQWLLNRFDVEKQPHIDMHSSQVMVTGIDTQGRMQLVIIDN